MAKGLFSSLKDHHAGGFWLVKLLVGGLMDFKTHSPFRPTCRQRSIDFSRNEHRSIYFYENLKIRLPLTTALLSVHLPQAGP